jgi:hypothetical protein
MPILFVLHYARLRMYNRRFHKESLQVMQDAAAKGQNLCHCLVMPYIPFQALHTPLHLK